LAEIRNPNIQGQGPGAPGSGGGGDMRSMMGFAALLLVVLLGYQYFFKPKTAPETTAQTQSQTAAQVQAGTGQTGTSQTGTSQTGTVNAQTGTANGPAGAASTPSVAAALETETTVENELYKIVFTNRGGQVKHWILKKYNDTAGQPLDMVQPQSAAQFGFPLSLYTYEPPLNTQLNQALYQVSVAGAQPSATGVVLAPASLTFQYAAGGLDVVKTFRFDSSYVVDIETHVLRNGSPVRALVEWPAGLGDM
jgi:YidC/Oxa1 family membrane protein insertase